MKTMKIEDILPFCRLCLSRSSQNMNFIISGSFSELPLQYYAENPSDIDIMSWHNNIHIKPEDSRIPIQFTGHIYKLETCNSPPGFTKIIEYESSKNWTYCGKKSRLAEPNNGPAFTKIAVEFNDRYKLYSDLVIGLRYSVWPLTAAEWKTRTRNNNWPPNDIIEKIITDGCHLVLKPHHSHPDDENEWRFSFSLAESTLANTWNGVQQYIYRTLRLVKCDVVKEAGGSDATILRTYHFKTLMFWACEDKPSSFWEETRIETSIKELLCQMIEWLIEKRCQNYFIPSCNLFDCDSSDVSNELSSLLKYAETFSSDLGRQVQIKGSVCLHVPKQCLLIVQMALTCMNLVNPSNAREIMFPSDFLVESPLLAEEIRWVYEAIAFHRDISSDSCDEEVRQSKVKEAISCFSLAKQNTVEDDNRSATVQLCDNVYGLIIAVYSNTNINERGPEANSGLDLSTEQILIPYGLNAIFEAMKHYLIRPSYFLRAAYEANFYYTVLHEYHLAKSICDDAFEALDDKQHNEVVLLGAEWANRSSDFLSIVIVDEWIPIFDEAIVVTTGFLTLFKAVKTTIGKLTAPSKTPVKLSGVGCLVGLKKKPLIRLNPVDFLRYIRLQCSRLLGEPQSDFCIKSNDFLTFCVNVSYRMHAPRRHGFRNYMETINYESSELIRLNY